MIGPRKLQTNGFQLWASLSYIYTYEGSWKCLFAATYPRKPELDFPQGFWTTSNMRKTKLIILPTKCLNTMGFLLLYLSCPAIGDWGRNRPDTEMSQWSITLDKEGSCGLIRNSREHELIQDGWKGYEGVGGGTPRNDTTPMTGYSAETDQGKPEAHCKIQGKSERRIARRETGERRTVSLDRRNAFRRVDNSNRNFRNIPRERRSDARRLSLDRRVRSTDEVRNRQRREREMRRMESGAESRLVEERRLSRRIENDDAATRRVSSEMRRSSRLGNVESRNVAERRERREDRRAVTGGRRSSERKVIQARRRDDPEERRSSPRRVEIRRDTSRERTARASAVRREERESGTRRNSITSDARGNQRSFERREPSPREEIKRFAVDSSRKKNSRARESQQREINAREKTRIDRYRGMESRISKRKEMKDAGEWKWELLTGMKNWFQQKTNREGWVMNNHFATTCLVGASVYLLTTRQIKAV